GVAGWAMRRWLTTVPAQTRVMDILAVSCVDPAHIPPQMMARAVAFEEEIALAHPDRAASHIRAMRSQLLQLARAQQYRRAMASLTMPVLLTHGRHDRLVPIAFARDTAARFPHWGYAELDSAHLPHIEHPERLAGPIADWLHDSNIADA